MEKEREREIGEIFQGRKDLQFLFIVHGNNYLFIFVIIRVVMITMFDLLITRNEGYVG